MLREHEFCRESCQALSTNACEERTQSLEKNHWRKGRTLPGAHTGLEIVCVLLAKTERLNATRHHRKTSKGYRLNSHAKLDLH